MNLFDFFSIKKPCENCPFRKEGSIPLEKGRLKKISSNLLHDDKTDFYCHKSVYSKNGGEWSNDNNESYLPSGNEKKCAGAAAYLMKQGRPSVTMRLALHLKIISKEKYESIYPLLKENIE